MSIHPKDVLFYGGGECFQKFGVPFMRQTRAQDVAATFTRTGAVGPFVDKSGVLRQASANRIRTTWIDTDGDGILDTPALVLEAGRTNIVASDDISSLSAQGTPVITGSVSDPAGGTSAYTVADNDGSAGEYPIWPLSFTGDGVKTVSFVVRENTVPGSGNQDLIVFDDTATATRLSLRLPYDGWVSGEPTVNATAGTLLEKRYLGDGYWLIRGQTTSITAANTNQAWVQAAAVGGGGTGSIDVYRVNAFDSEVSPLFPLAASDVLGADTLFAPFLPSPREMTVLVDFVESGTSLVANYGLFQVGSSTASAGAFLSVFTSATAGRYRVTFNNGIDSNVTAAIGASGAVAVGDRVRVRVVLGSDGAVTLGVQIGEDAEVTASASAPTSGLPAAWEDRRMYIGSLGSTNHGLASLVAVKAVRGSRSMAEIRSVYEVAA